MHKYFSLIDVNGDGIITLEDLKKANEIYDLRIDINLKLCIDSFADNH